MQRVGLNRLGLLVFAVMVFPVYWMVSTAFKPRQRDPLLHAEVDPADPTLDNFRDAIGRDRTSGTTSRTA